MSRAPVAERANAKVNLVLRVGAPRADGLHPICSLFAALELADEVRVTPLGDAAGGADAPDQVVCVGVEGDNLAAAAAAAFRAAARAATLPPLRIEIEKRIPVAAGLAGGSADAAAVLRAANRIAGAPLTADELRGIAATLGSDVPSQVEPAHAIVSGTGERVERVALAPLTVVLLPQAEGLSTAAVYRELDRLRAAAGSGQAGEIAAGGSPGAPSTAAEPLDPAPLRALARTPAAGLAAALANDLQAATLSLRPELAARIAALRDAGALAAQVSGSGPTVFGLFADRAAAEAAAERIAVGDGPAPIVTDTLGS